MNKSLILIYVILIFGNFHSEASAEELQLQGVHQSIEELTGAKGTWNEEEQVFKVSFPRSDLDVKVAGAKITPPMGLTSWAAFKLMGNHAMVMGDLVLLEKQVNAVMDVALENGLEVTALHNHFFWDSPKVMFMHIGGDGEIETLAGSVGKVFHKMRETIHKEAATPYFEVEPSKTTLNPEKIEEILGVKGTLKDGVFKVVIGRTTKMNGHEMGKEMGVNTWAAFAGADEKAVVDGDFAMLESELQDVLKALRRAKVSIVAIHNHMTMENPRMIFLHYWGTGSTEDLAKALQSALNVQRIEL